MIKTIFLLVFCSEYLYLDVRFNAPVILCRINEEKRKNELVDNLKYDKVGET